MLPFRLFTPFHHITIDAAFRHYADYVVIDIAIAC
jgi:hypothetical protein